MIQPLIFRDRRFLAAVLALITIVSRLPFIDAGYGVEEDSWGIAVAAHNSSVSGMFESSRLPGHPVPEMIYTLLWNNNPVLYNLLSVLMSVAAVCFFYFSLLQLGYRQSFWAALAFSFVPVFYISGTYTIDYVWAIAFVLGSFYFLLKSTNEQSKLLFLVSALLLGIAIGCRITSGAMLLPFAVVLYDKHVFMLAKKMFLFSMVALTVALLAFLPVINEHGIFFFQYYDQFPYPSLPKLLYKASIGVWGLTGMLAIVVLKPMSFANRLRLIPDNFTKPINKKVLYASIAVLVLYTISYFRLPQKSGYMMPMVPFGILAFVYFLNTTRAFLFFSSIIISPFIMSINLTDPARGAEYSSSSVIFKSAGQEIFIDPLSGPVFSDYSKRKLKMNFTKKVLNMTDTLQQKSLLICGWWYNMLLVEQYERNNNPNAVLTFYASPEKIDTSLAKGYRIYYLPEQNLYNNLMFKMNITDSVAKPFVNP